jgi:tripartite-type tricarboxylate transporter receptor subunit TctC
MNALRVFVVLVILLPCAVDAAAWPERTVRFVVPNPPGSPVDAAARWLAERLSKRWNQPVVVEDRQGNDGIPAVMAIVNAHDDYTFLFSFAGVITINPLIHDTLPYDAAHDLVPIASVADNFLAVATSAKLKIATLASFIEAARGQGGKLNWAATPGLPAYVFLMMQKRSGIDIVRAPYREFAPALQDLGEGRIQAIATSLQALVPLRQAGRANILFVTNRQRSPLAPDVPTAAEAGFPELTFEGVIGLYGPRSLSSDLRDRIAADLVAEGGDSAFGELLAKAASAPRLGMPDAFAAAIAEQRVKVAIAAKDVP